MMCMVLDHDQLANFIFWIILIDMPLPVLISMAQFPYMSIMSIAAVKVG